MARSTPPDKELVSFRLRKELKRKLAALAEATGRSQTFLAEEALESYCDLHHWQVQAIREGIEDADKGNLHTTADVLEHLERQRGKRL
jgi:RHH-type transcriptional regulator, rel operon repressor / antitoxin RelB